MDVEGDFEIDFDVDRDSPEDEDDLEGCRYQCPTCGAFFRGATALAEHVGERHGGGLGATRDARIEERWTNCKMCKERILHDRMDIACHLWTKHGMLLEAYQENLRLI